MTVQVRRARQLTSKQREVLCYIVARICEGSPPSLRETMRHFGIKSPQGAKCHLDALIRKGFITHTPKRAYGIEVVGLEVTVNYSSDPAGVRLREVLEQPQENPQ